MPHSYAPQFRAMVVDQVRSGMRVAEVAASVEVAEATVYRWVRQDRIDRGEPAGTSSVDNAELRAARRRIAELESELAVVKRASALFNEGRVVRPKAVFDIVETLAREGHGTKRVCRLLRVAPSGFFRWRAMPPSDRSIRRAWLTDVIVEIHDQSRRTYWWRRIRAELADAYGQRVNKKLIRAIMAEQAISGLPRRRKGKPNLVHRATSADLVDRVFHRDGPNQLWMTDIERHEVLLNPAVVKGHRLRLCRSGPVAAEGSLIPGTRGRVDSSHDNDGTGRHCQTVRVRQARRKGVREEPASGRLSRRDHQLEPGRSGLGSSAHLRLRGGNSLVG
jgi:transposase-like protein